MEAMWAHGPSWLAVALISVIGWLLRRALSQFEDTLEKVNDDMIQSKIHVAKLQKGTEAITQRIDMHEAVDKEHHEESKQDRRDLWSAVTKLQGVR